jgi:hypothetical protein
MAQMQEPSGDIAAQIQAVANPGSAKDAAFVVRGAAMPKIPENLLAVSRPEGTLITSNPTKAAMFRQSPALHDTLMAHLLGYPETKTQAFVASGGAPAVVQGVTPSGAVAHESAASLQGLASAITAARAAAPIGHVRVSTPAEALRRRTVGLLG